MQGRHLRQPQAIEQSRVPRVGSSRMPSGFLRHQAAEHDFRLSNRVLKSASRLGTATDRTTTHTGADGGRQLLRMQMTIGKELQPGSNWRISQRSGAIRA